MTSDLFTVATIERPARIHAGMVFGFGGRLLRVARIYPGDDAATPIIVEELAPIGVALAGQFALWSAAGVVNAVSRSAGN